MYEQSVSVQIACELHLFNSPDDLIFETLLKFRISYFVVDQAMEMVGQAGKLPENAPSEDENDEDLLKKVHHALVEIEVVQGHLECPESGRQFPITNGIPNMLLNENEV